MPIVLDHQMREQIVHDTAMFPITYFYNELALLPDSAGPLHWHSEFEIATAMSSALEFQVGQRHVVLRAGDSIFVNSNVLHGIRQISAGTPDPMPNIVFSCSAVAPETSTIYQKYIQPVAFCGALPFIVFRQEDWHKEIDQMLRNIYCLMDKQGPCYEMAVQRGLSRIFEYIFLHFDDLPKYENTRIQIHAQIRIQKMLSFIYEHYHEDVTLADIAGAAGISRSEAGRCFHAYLGCSPVDALIKYRLQTAHRLLDDTSLTLQEVSASCGFHSVNYFSRQYRKAYGCAPRRRTLGK